MPIKGRGRETHCRNRLRVLLEEFRQSLDAADIARCVKRCLRKEELEHLCDNVAGNAASSSVQLEAFVSTVSERAMGREDAQDVVVAAAQDTIGGYQKARKFLSLPGKRVWSRLRGNLPKKPRGRPIKIDSVQIRKDVRVYLLENSSTTAKLVKVDNVAVPVYNLKSSKYKLWCRSPHMQKLLGKSLWFQHLKKHHANFTRLKTRTDICVFCHKYDRVLLPTLKLYCNHSNFFLSDS